ncbi:MAG: protein RarD [Pelagibacteraceae bacterium TMED216]|nr:MAG: protein RarD [Pelagibacteraceae bacterium TMED216]
MKKKLFEGSLYTVGASLWWGIIGVIYFKFVSFASPIEITIHRTLWTCLLLVITTTYFKKWPKFIKFCKSYKTIFLLFLTGLLVSINWFTWLYSISVNNMLDASLGYYIFPIFSVFFGKIFLKEKINKNKIIAIVLVFISIIYLLIGFKNIPWIGLTVAITFSLYSLIRKKINISSDLGLLCETLLISPIALILFSILVVNNDNIFGFNNIDLSIYLFFAGFMTLVPLFMYIKGFKLIGIGPASMIFFLTPTAQFFLSIFYLDQILNTEKLISFVFVWIAVLIYLNELRKE